VIAIRAIRWVIRTRGCNRIAGNGGDVTIGSEDPVKEVLLGDILLSGTKSDEAIVNADGTISVESPYLPDMLPPRPPTIKTTAPEILTADGRLLLLNTSFIRGILTTGGMGGAGTDTTLGFGGGGQGGAGGKILISPSPDGDWPRGNIVFRDVDLLTGGHIESVKLNIRVTQSGSGTTISPKSVTFSTRSGALGGGWE